MPTYQYACKECSHGFEIVQAFSDDALTQCPECSGQLRKVFNSVGVVFKGSGFYRTDSRSGSSSSLSSDSGPGSGGGSGSSSGSGGSTESTSSGSKESASSTSSSGSAPAASTTSTSKAAS